MKNYVKTFCCICLLFSALYCIAIADLEYGYYTFIRIASFVGIPVLAFLWFLISDKFLTPVMIIPAIIFILFNPVLPIYLDKDTWVVLDAICAICLIVLAAYVWFTKRNIDDGKNEDGSNEN